MATSSDPDNVVQEATAGITKGALTWTKEEVLAFIHKLRNKELAFIGDEETIRILKEQLSTGEWDISTKYVDDRDLKLLIQMGLTLRKLEELGELDKLHNLRKKILSKYSKWGLHVAQFVQRKILTDYLVNISSKISSVKELKFAIKDTLENVDKFVVFIQEKDDNRVIQEMIRTRVYAHKPESFIIFSKSTAVSNGEKVINGLKKTLKGYSFEYKVSENKDKIYFLNRKEEKEE